MRPLAPASGTTALASYARSFPHGAEIFFGGMEDHWNVPACHFDHDGRYDRLQPFVRDPWTNNRLRQRLLRPHHSRASIPASSFAMRRSSSCAPVDSSAPLFMYVSFMAPARSAHHAAGSTWRCITPAKLICRPNLMPEHPFDNGELQVRDELLAAFPRTLTRSADIWPTTMP